MAHATVPRFHELRVQVKRRRIREGSVYPPSSSYRYATVVNESSSWFQPRKICQATCCAESVAISLYHEDERIVNTIDGADLADVRLVHYEPKPWQIFPSNILNLDTLPCIQPGTIFFLENHIKIILYFFDVVLPRIQVPFIMVTGKSDGNSPYPAFADVLYKDNPKVLKWYGTNALLPTTGRSPKKGMGKLVPMHLGLSQRYNQEFFIRPYLELTNFTNPFWNKQPWLDLLKRPRVNGSVISGTRDIFVHFGMDDKKKPQRSSLWKVLCPQISRNRVSSCQTAKLETSDIYDASSRFRFGVSPPGMGWDCYRTYELLLLGIIPIVSGREVVADALFEGLPVIQLPDLFQIQSMQELEQKIEDYLRSDAFQKATFDGWKRLFLGYWRRKILHDAGRDHEILQDKQGREYYQAWKYTPANSELIMCSQKGSCELPK